MPITEYFSKKSKLAQLFPNYVVRDGQIKMAKAVAHAIENRSALLIEAGTGIGKTLGYLIPALASGGKVMISTGTKALQDQLFFRDLPNVCKALNMPITTALLKGRANYVCHYHLGKALNDNYLRRETWHKDLKVIAEFAINSKSGDRADCNGVSDNSGAWNHSVSTRENCLGTNCPNSTECFLNKARKNALSADVLVVNHYLFFADIAIRENGGQDLLPASHIIVFDEAHQVCEVASKFFSDSVTSAQLRELARDSRKELMTACPDMPEIHKDADAIEYRSNDLIICFQVLPERALQKNVIADSACNNALTELIQSLIKLEQTLAKVVERSIGLQKVHERCEMALETLRVWQEPILATVEKLPQKKNASELINQLQNIQTATTFIHWLERTARYVNIVRTPLSIATSMARQYSQTPRTWIFCSATLAIGNDFKMVRRDLGLDNIERGYNEEVILSPFDYQNNALLYIPKELPAPNETNYFSNMVDTIVPLINKCGGGVFVLCTSNRAVALFKNVLPEHINNRPILVQNDKAHHQLLAEFREHGNAILIGTHTFWEGVDFSGKVLSMVIIDKLPFAPPDDPIQKAVGDEIVKQGGNMFFDLQIPQAAIMLKQGAGRLIRSESDKGVLIICDSRLHTKAYGKRLIKAIPPMRVAKDINEVGDFLEKIA